MAMQITVKAAMMTENATQPCGPSVCLPVAANVNQVTIGTTIIVKPFQPIDPVKFPKAV